MAKETQYYDALGVSPTATADEIKRAYRRLALQFHPDKNPDGADRFQQISLAWEVLGDEKLRGVYDTHGQMGVDMAKQFGDSFQMFMGPQMESMVITLFCFSSIAVVLISLFPIFVALRADEAVSWNWTVVFIPVWIVDSIWVLFLLGRYFLATPGDEQDPRVNPEAGTNAATAAEEGFHPDGTPMSAEEQQQQRAERKRILRRMDVLMGIKQLVFFGFFLAFQILIVRKLNDDASVSTWASVFVPWWILEGLWGLGNAVQYMLLIWAKDSPFVSQEGLDGLRLSARQKLQLLWLFYKHWVLRVVLSVLIVLRADELISVNWAVVFLPLYLQYLYLLLAPTYEYYTFGRKLTGEQRDSFRVIFVTKMVATVTLGIIFFIMLGLLVGRWNGTSSVTLASIFIPLFIVLGVTFCCCCCCLPCMVVSTRIAEEQQAQGGTPLPLHVKRITFGAASAAPGPSSSGRPGSASHLS